MVMIRIMINRISSIGAGGLQKVRGGLRREAARRLRRGLREVGRRRLSYYYYYY